MDAIRYDPATGSIEWRLRKKGRKQGVAAGHVKADKRTKYRRITIDGSRYYAHRLAWLLHYGVWPRQEIDHIDGNGLNNAINNLREASTTENNRNARMHLNNTSGFNGVCWIPRLKKWQARIQVDGKKISLGCFSSRENAKSAYEHEKRKHGFTSRHGISGVSPRFMRSSMAESQSKHNKSRSRR